MVCAPGGERGEVLEVSLRRTLFLYLPRGASPHELPPPALCLCKHVWLPVVSGLIVYVDTHTPSSSMLCDQRLLWMW